MHAETQTALDVMLTAGTYRPTPTRVVGFADVPTALADIAARRSAGRIVVDIRS